MRRLLSSILSLTLVTASSSAAPQSTSAQAGRGQTTTISAPATVKGDLGTKLDELLTRYTPYGFSGAALIAKNDEIVLHKAYGLANRTSGAANTLDTSFEIGSLTKTFTAAAILQLEMRGKLSVNDAIGKYLDSLPPDKGAITIYHLLSHTSGLVRDTGNPEIPPNASRDELLQRSLSAPLQSVPGQKYSYSNLGFTVLAAIVEKASDQTWQNYLRERLFKPAGLTRTVFWEPSMAGDARIAVGYRGPSVDLLETDQPETIAWSRGMGATGILSTAGDLYRWWLALQKDGILSEAARKKMFTAPTVGDEPYGWHIEKAASGPARIHKGGVVSAFEAQFAHYPEAGVVMIFAMNKNISMRAPLWQVIEQVVFGKEYMLPPVIVASNVALPKYAGEYELPSGGQFRAWVEQNHLMLGAIGQDAVNLIVYPGNRDPQLHRDTNATTEKVIEALKKGELAGLKEVPDPSPVQRFWQSAKERFGAVKSYHVLGTMPRSPGVVQTYARIEFENATEVIRFSWSGGRLGPMGGGIPLPAMTSFIPQSETTFAAFDYRTSQIVRLAFDKDASGNISGLRVLSIDGQGNVVAKKTK